MVWVHQAYAGGDNAMPIVINIVAKGDVKLIFELHQAGHSIRRGTIHADFAIAVQGHERKSGVHAVIDNLDIQAVHFSHRHPVIYARSAEWINPDFYPGG